MPRIAVCTVCSREKSRNPKLLPVWMRYTGSHITKVREIARLDQCPFFVLSGVYGFIEAGLRIPFYNHLLKAEEIERIVLKVREQVEGHRFGEIHFYTKITPEWELYRTVMEKALDNTGIRLSIHELENND